MSKLNKVYGEVQKGEQKKMEKIDKRIRYFIGLDTETANGIVIDDKLDLSQSLVYDLGYVITDKRGKIYKTRSFIIADIFFDYADMMKSAYYAKKIPQYIEDIKNGSRRVVTFATARKILINDMKEYNINTVFAHNARFDLNALNNTERYLTKSKYRYFFPYGTIIYDTLKMCKVISNQVGYKNFCEENGYITNHRTPRARETAEILYRYLTGDNDFIEEHKGLDDVLIETVIFAECWKKHKKMRKLLFEE